MKKKFLFNNDTEKVINGQKTVIVQPLSEVVGSEVVGSDCDDYGDCAYGIYDDKIYLSKNGRGIGDYKLPLAVGGEYYVCQNGKELGIDKFRGSLKWLDRRAVGIEYLQNKFKVESARICKFCEITDDEWSANGGCDVRYGEGEYMVVYRISMIRP